MKNPSIILLLLLVHCFNLQAQNYCDYEDLFIDSIAMTQLEILTYRTDVMNYDSTTTDLNLYIHRPIDSYSDILPERPAIIAIHDHRYPNYDNLAAAVYTESIVEEYAQRGYVTVSIQYRQDIRNFSPIDSCGSYSWNALGTHYRALQDTRHAMQYIYNNASSLGIDKDNIFIGGVGQGAMAALHATFIEESSDILSVDWGWFFSLLEDYWGPIPDRIPIRGIFSFSGFIYDLNFIDGEEQIPMFLIHGNCDNEVPLSLGNLFGCEGGPMVCGSTQIACQAEQRSVPYLFYSVEDVGHEWPDLLTSLAYGATRNFFKDNVLCQEGTFESEYISVTNTEAPISCDPVSTDPTDNDNCLFDNSESSTSNWDYSTESFIKIFPNPAKDYIQIHTSIRDSQISIFSMKGELIKQLYPNNSNQSIDISHLPNGIYLVHIEGEKQSHTKKIMVER